MASRVLRRTRIRRRTQILLGILFAAGGYVYFSRQPIDPGATTVHEEHSLPGDIDRPHVVEPVNAPPSPSPPPPVPVAHLSTISTAPRSEGTCAQRMATRYRPPNATAWAARARLYGDIEAALAANGLEVFNPAGASSQGLALQNMFTITEDTVHAVLRPLDVPVRAIVVPFAAPDVATMLHGAAVDALAGAGVRGSGVFFQHESTFHSSLWHASHHVDPKPATGSEVDAEARAVGDLAARTCPFEAALERVVVTPTGVILACWQVIGGSEPAAMRAALGTLLPKSPAKQLYDPFILHTTLARLIKPPRGGGIAMATLAREMSEKLCGLRIRISTLWYLEELDVLALGLGGRYDRRQLFLSCPTGESVVVADTGESR